MAHPEFQYVPVRYTRPVSIPAGFAYRPEDLRALHEAMEQDWRIVDSVHVPSGPERGVVVFHLTRARP